MAAGTDYLTDFDEWLAIQNGSTMIPMDDETETPRFIRTMRDLGHYVHVDQLYEAYLNAALILLGMNAPVDRGNPYNLSNTQFGFATFGGPHLLSLVTEVATRALKAVWYQKWIVHRRLRPEAYGGLVHLQKSGARDYALPAQIVDSEAVARTRARYGTYLMPMAFPEGSPTHPAYGAGHATVAGACVTVLKAWFDEEYIIPNPVVPNHNGQALLPYFGSDSGQLTVRGELNKVAANISIGRNMAGVHWRTDYTASVRLGELVALSILIEQSDLYNERLPDGEKPSFSLTRFNGQKVTVRGGELLDAAGGQIDLEYGE